MRAVSSYDYAVVRLVPRVDREEFINVGVILSCPEHNVLIARIELNEARIRALCPSVDLDLARTHLASIPRICAGGVDAGPIGRLSQRERFYWLVAPRSTIIQTSAVHSGRCDEPEPMLERLMNAMVRCSPDAAN